MNLELSQIKKINLKNTVYKCDIKVYNRNINYSFVITVTSKINIQESDCRESKH